LLSRQDREARAPTAARQPHLGTSSCRRGKMIPTAAAATRALELRQEAAGRKRRTLQASRSAQRAARPARQSRTLQGTKPVAPEAGRWQGRARQPHCRHLEPRQPRRRARSPDSLATTMQLASRIPNPDLPGLCPSATFVCPTYQVSAAPPERTRGRRLLQTRVRRRPFHGRKRAR
jgi:hypothetical protein